MIPSALRNEVVAALNAGMPAGAIEVACKVSRPQLNYWRAATEAMPQPNVLSVAEGGGPGHSTSETSIELCVGTWLINLGRDTD